MTDSEHLLHREVTATPKAETDSDQGPPHSSTREPVNSSYKTSRIFLLILTLCCVVCAIYFFIPSGSKPKGKGVLPPTQPKGVHFGDPSLTGRMLTREELAKYDSHGSPILLAIMGRVYDVTKSRAYQADGSYPFFAGLDGTRAFATGEFNEEGLTDDITGLDDDSVRSIADWVKTYDEEYTFVGRLVGTYFDEKGEATPALGEAHKLLKKSLKQKSKQDQEKIKFPPCNGRFNQAEGQVVWCSNLSGGIQRNWDGKPRKYFDKTIRTKRCACVKDSLLDSPLLELYEGCDPQSAECKIKPSSVGIEILQDSQQSSILDQYSHWYNCRPDFVCQEKLGKLLREGLTFCAEHPQNNSKNIGLIKRRSFVYVWYIQKNIIANFPTCITPDRTSIPFRVTNGTSTNSMNWLHASRTSMG